MRVTVLTDAKLLKHIVSTAFLLLLSIIFQRRHIITMGQILRLLINVIAGSSLLITGVWFLSQTASRVFKDKIPQILAEDNPVRVFWASTALTAVLQSSTAISILAVSFADSGFLSLSSAMAAIYGANLGTCVTAQIMSLEITEYGIHILLTGIVLRLAAVSIKPLKSISENIAAIGLLFTGLMTLSLSIPIIKSSPLIMSFISEQGNSRTALIIAGFLMTALVNSSSATVGLTMTLFSGGIINFTQAVYIVFGDNIGTCVTAQIAARGAGIRGRRVALGHILYNIIGTVLACLFAKGFINAVIFMTNLLNQSDYYLVANAHLLFNILSAVFFMPLNKWFCAMLIGLYGDKELSKNNLH